MRIKQINRKNGTRRQLSEITRNCEHFNRQLKKRKQYRKDCETEDPDPGKTGEKPGKAGKNLEKPGKAGNGYFWGRGISPGRKI